MNSLSIKNFRVCIIALVYALLMVTFMITAPKAFLSYRIYRSFLSTVPFSLIMALGLTLVITAGEIDLSFATVMTFSGFVFTFLFREMNNSILALVGSLFAGAMAGLLNGVIVSKMGIPSIITTLGTQFLWGGLAVILSGGRSSLITEVRSFGLYNLLVGRVGGLIPAQALWAIGVSIILWFILNRHRFGEHIMFVGDNRDAARMIGVNVDRTLILVFTLSGMLAAFSSILLASEMVCWWPTQGPGYLLITIAAVFIGGTSIYGGEGTIFGTVIGAFLVGSITAGIVASRVGGFWTQFIVGVVMLIAIMLNTILSRKRT